MGLHYSGEIQIAKLEVGKFSNNCYIVACPKTREGIIIDTPAEPERILEAAQSVLVRGIVITHAHGDHLGAFGEVTRELAAPVYVHPLEAAKIPPCVHLPLEDGQLLQVGTVRIQVIHTPGHTPGSICLLIGKHLFSGDTLFPGGPGATRTPEAFREIVQTITTRLFPLPDDTLVYPGHGLDTVLQKEKEEYRLFCEKEHRPDLCGDVLWLSA